MTTYTLHSTTFNEDIIFQFDDEIVTALNGFHACRQFSSTQNGLTLQSPTLVNYGSYNFIFGTDINKSQSSAFTTDGYIRLALRAGEIYNNYSDIIQYIRTLKVTIDNVDYPLDQLSYFNTYQNSDYPVPLTPPLYQSNLWGKTIVFSKNVPSVNKATFSNTLYNCTLSNVQSEYTSETEYITNIIADNHYYFADTPYLQYYKNGNVQKVYFTKINDYQYSINFNDYVDNNSIISVYADSVICKKVYANIVYLIDNDITLLNRPTTQLEDDLPKAFILNKPNIYNYNETKVTYYDKNSTLHTIQGVRNNNECIITIPNTVEFLPESTITVIANLVTTERNVNYNIANCISNIHPNKYVLGDTLNFIFTPTQGYFFNTYVSLSYYCNGEKLQVFGSIIEGLGYLTLELFNVDENTDIDIFATAIKEDNQITKLYNNMISVYQVDKQNIEDIASSRFSVISSEYIYETVDLGKYIKSLKRYFFDIDTLGTSTIQLGNATINTIAQNVENAIYNISLGVKNISRIYNTQNDFTDIEIIAILPFIGTVRLDNSFIGRNIEIVYRVNIVTDDCKILFIDDDTGELLKTESCLMSFDIPYMTLDEKNNYLTDVDFNSDNMSLLYDIQPTIIIRNKNVINQNYNSTNFNSVLGVLNGFVSVNEVDLSNIFAYKEELDLIDNELKRGVIL